MRLSVTFFAALLAVFGLSLSACQGQPAPGTGPVVLAASSMQEALEAAADGWEAAGHARPVLSFASSAVVARQASEGAPADLVVTADEEWMDWMEQRQLLRPASRRTLAGNTLVLVAPRATGAAKTVPAQEALRGLSGRLAVAEPETVPAGRYAMAALTRMGLADGLADRRVPTENVRAALALVERGEAELGIVYATDARASGKVTVVATFEPDLHPPIRYPLAVLASSANPEAESFATYLESPAGQAILVSFGFSPGL